MNLHIGLDGSRIAKARYTGTEHYSHEIFEHIFRVAPHHRYTIYAPAQPTKPLDTGRADITWKIIPFPKFWTQVRLSLEFLSGEHPDILFVPSHTIPLVHPRSTVTTVHDLGFRHFPEYYGLTERLYQNFGLRQAVRGSTRIIAVSQATKDDLVTFTNYPADRVDVIHHGVDRELFRPPTPNERPSAEQKKLQPYLYSIGRLEAKKNTPGLIRAFRILKEKYALPHRLVLAGKPGPHGYDAVQTALDELPSSIRQQVVLAGYLPDEQHASWLRFADCLVFPSGFEGFGLPAVEAMASDVPVITSKASCLPEIVADAGVLVNQTRAEAIAEGIASVVRDPARRAELVERGRKRVRLFSWERAASATVATLEEAARERRRTN